MGDYNVIGRIKSMSSDPDKALKLYNTRTDNTPDSIKDLMYGTRPNKTYRKGLDNVTLQKQDGRMPITEPITSPEAIAKMSGTQLLRNQELLKGLIKPVVHATAATTISTKSADPYRRALAIVNERLAENKKSSEQAAIKRAKESYNNKQMELVTGVNPSAPVPTTKPTTASMPVDDDVKKLVEYYRRIIVAPTTKEEDAIINEMTKWTSSMTYDRYTQLKLQENNAYKIAMEGVK